MRITIWVEAGQPPSGRLSANDEAPTLFMGWLELLALLEERITLGEEREWVRSPHDCPPAG